MLHSKSFKDVQSVAQMQLASKISGEGASAPTKVDSYPTHDSMPPILDVESGTLVAFQAQKRGEEANSFECSQVCENDVAQVIIVCEPDLHNNLMGALHPNGALYEAPVNMTKASSQHEGLRRMLRDNGVKVLTVREILLFGCSSSIHHRVALEDLAGSRLTYELDDDETPGEESEFYTGNAYKKEVLEQMSAEQLVDVVLCKPTVKVRHSFRDTGFTASYSFKPLTNLQFTRDQQITTARGIVLSRMRSSQRQHEVDVMKFCFKKLGLKVVGAVEAPGFLEGGDFFPGGSERCFFGVGVRSNVEAVQQLMLQDLCGTNKVVVVKDELDRSQDRMHLDCYFNIISSNCVLLLDEAMGVDAPLHRVVDEYEKRAPLPGERGQRFGEYLLVKKNIEFSVYLHNECGYNIITLTKQEQLAYACNCLNLGGGRILSCHLESARRIVRSPFFNGDMQFLPFDEVTKMYGALHCSTQVVARQKA